MGKHKKEKSGPKMVLPGWMASYADMFTVLMVFFVLLFSMSHIDQDLFDRFIASFGPDRQTDFSPIQHGAGDIAMLDGAGIMDEVEPSPPAGAEGDYGGTGEIPPLHMGGHQPIGDTVGDLMNTFRMYMATEAPGGEGDYPIPVPEPGDGYMRINIDDAGGVFFDSARATLTTDAVRTLHSLGPMMRTFVENGNGIVIEGHTDNRPINTAHFPSNWELSGARAASVVRFFVDNYDVDVHMIAGLGRGEFFPVNPENNPEAWAQNRRVEIKIFTLDEMHTGPIGGWFRIPGTPGA